MNYHFPRCKYASTNSAEQQATHILSEAIEFAKAIIGGEFFEERDLEAMDLLHSLETYFWIREHGRGPGYVEDLRQAIIHKNQERGYY